jgi:hypothetical protein
MTLSVEPISKMRFWFPAKNAGSATRSTQLVPA